MISQERVDFNLQHIDAMKKHATIHRVSCDLEKPKTIQEKLMWLNIYDAEPLKSECADKILVKEYAKRVIGSDICVPTLAVWNKVDDVDFSVLPNQFVIKCNHGSGMNIIVKDKSTLNESDARSKLRRWMNDNFAFRNGFESHYNWIERKIFAETLIGDGSTNLLDFKFWCFNGEPQFWTINNGHGHGDIMYYWMDGSVWNPYEVREHKEYIKPKSFNKMVEYSRLLSEPFKFVRVDFYEIKGSLVLGEMTFTPGANIFKYNKHEDDIKAGDLLKL